MELNKPQPRKPQLGRGLDKLLGQQPPVAPPSLAVASPVISAQQTDTAHPNPSSEPARKRGASNRRTTDLLIKRFKGAAERLLRERSVLIQRLRRIEEALSLSGIVPTQETRSG
jgi:hypothetical protein